MVNFGRKKQMAVVAAAEALSAMSNGGGGESDSDSSGGGSDKNRGEQKLWRKAYVIPLYVASFFSLNLSYALKKTHFGLVTHHIFLQ